MRLGLDSSSRKVSMTHWKEVAAKPKAQFQTGPPADFHHITGVYFWVSFEDNHIFVINILKFTKIG